MLRSIAPGPAGRGRIDACNSSLGGRAHRRSGRCPERNPDRRSARHRLAYGHAVTVTGRLSPGERGADACSSSSPRPGRRAGVRLRAHRVRGDGSFQFVAPMKHSGLMRVERFAGGDRSGIRAAECCADARRALRSGCRFRRTSGSASRSVDVLGGQPVRVRGKLLPGVGGRRVRLIGRSGGSWQTLARARTGRRGGFDLRYSPGATGRRLAASPVRGRSAEQPGPGPTRVQLTVFRESVASWYNDGGATACGFHASSAWRNQTPAVWHQGDVPQRRAHRARRSSMTAARTSAAASGT